MKNRKKYFCFGRSSDGEEFNIKLSDIRLAIMELTDEHSVFIVRKKQAFEMRIGSEDTIGLVMYKKQTNKTHKYSFFEDFTMFREDWYKTVYHAK